MSDEKDMPVIDWPTVLAAVVISLVVTATISMIAQKVG